MIYALRILGAIATLGLIVLSVVVAWAPIERAEDVLRERLGAYEHVGWLGTGLHLLYTLAFTAVVLAVVAVVVGWPLKRLSDRMSRATAKRLEPLAQYLAVAMIHWLLFLPVLGWMAIGVVNPLWDRAPARAERYRYVGTTHRSKGPARIDYEQVDGPRDALALEEIHPPHDTKPGDIVTLHWHDGALGLPYVSAKPLGHGGP